MVSYDLAYASPTDIPVNVRDDLMMDKYLSAGKQDGEVELFETSQGKRLLGAEWPKAEDCGQSRRTRFT